MIRYLAMVLSCVLVSIAAADTGPAACLAEYHASSSTASWQGRAPLHRYAVSMHPGHQRRNLEVVVNIPSFTSGDAQRDEKMRLEVFESDLYSDIVLKLENLDQIWLSGVNTERFEPNGIMNLHGVRRRVAVPITVEHLGGWLLLRATIMVRLSDFNMARLLGEQMDDELQLSLCVPIRRQSHPD